MRRTVKTAALVGILAATAVGVKAAGYDFWRYGEYRATLAAEANHGQELDERLEAAEGRLAAKEAVVSDYLAQRTTFEQVVEQFRRVNEENANIAALMRVYYPTADDREVAARNAYNFIAAAVARDSSHRRRLLSQLSLDIDRQFTRPVAPLPPAG